MMVGIRERRMIGEAVSMNGSRQALTAEQRRFIGAVNETAAMLSSNRMDRDEWMVIAGGAVFLYQLDSARRNGTRGADRVPTDLDVVVNNAPEREKHILELLRDGMASRERVTYSKGPDDHFGHTLLGAKLGYASVEGLPIDVITDLSQIYPADHRFAPSLHYEYPPTDVLLPFAKRITHPLLDGPVMLAHPGFVAYYKLMLSRNTDGKQDGKDLTRLKRLGLLEPSDELREVIDIMCHSDADLVDKVEKAIADL